MEGRELSRRLKSGECRHSDDQNEKSKSLLAKKLMIKVTDSHLR